MSGGGIRAVFFDAVGTLIHPEPAAATVYARIGQRFGTRLGVDAIRQAFAKAFAGQEELDRRQGWRTDEQREVERWRSIVAEVLSDVSDDSCFAALYEHFRQAANWRYDPAASAVIQELAGRGHVVGIASNFDRRLRDVLHGFPNLASLGPVVISSEVGWRKPAVEFFQALGKASRSACDEVLYLGDDLVNDYEGARRAGCRALLFAPQGLPLHGVQGVAHLADVLKAI